MLMEVFDLCFSTIFANITNQIEARRNYPVELHLRHHFFKKRTMKAKLNYALQAILFFFILGVAIPNSLAQITITSSDILKLIGNSYSVQEDSSEVVTVNVGQAGANQTWDFSQVDFNKMSLGNINYVDPADTPYAGVFPESNLAQTVTSDELEGEGALYLYDQVTDSEFKTLGSVIEASFDGVDTSFIFMQEERVAPLPVTYQSTWTDITADTTEFLGTIFNISIDTTVNTVDGWGTIKLPGIDLPCLRLRSDTREMSFDLFGNQTMRTYISYLWLTASNLISVSVVSQDDETDPNFTQADFVSIITGSTVPVFDVDQNSTKLLQNAPNPFQVSTVINYEVETAETIDISVFDQTGKKVKTLVTGLQLPGKYQITWNGLNDSGVRLPSGTYFYRMESETTKAIRSMIFLD